MAICGETKKACFVLFFSTNPGNLLHDDTIRAGGQKEGADSYCCHWRPEKGRSMILSNYTTLVLLHLHYYHKYSGFIRKTLKDFFYYLSKTRWYTAKGRLPLPKRMNFRKSSKRPLTPPPHFRKVMLQIFSEIHDRSIVYNGKNLQHKFLD